MFLILTLPFPTSFAWKYIRLSYGLFSSCPLFITEFPPDIPTFRYALWLFDQSAHRSCGLFPAPLLINGSSALLIAWSRLFMTQLSEHLTDFSFQFAESKQQYFPVFADLIKNALGNPQPVKWFWIYWYGSKCIHCFKCYSNLKDINTYQYHT